MKSSFRTLIATLLSASATLSSFAGQTLNLAHYNIHHGEPKRGKYDVRRTLAAVEWEKQDLIAMNEVDWKSKRVGGADTPADIERLTGRHVEYVKAKPYGGGFYGNAVVSKEKPLSVVTRKPPEGRAVMSRTGQFSVNGTASSRRRSRKKWSTSSALSLTG